MKLYLKTDRRKAIIETNYNWFGKRFRLRKADIKMEKGKVFRISCHIKVC